MHDYCCTRCERRATCSLAGAVGGSSSSAAAALTMLPGTDTLNFHLKNLETTNQAFKW
jgi:hypothetical protein